MLLLVTTYAMAQQPKIQNFRPYNKNGLNMFEIKNDTVPFTGLKVRLGGNFTQQFQSLNHSNSLDTSGTGVIDANADNVDDRKLIGLTNGFNLATANLNIDVQLYDGITMNMMMYLSSRHHQETWVKGGYLRFDKLTFLNSPGIDNLMQYLTIKLGDYEVNYGDQHYRRSDNGNTMYNPFVENYIMDAFTTEIGGEVDFHYNGLIAVGQITGGEIKGNVVEPTNIDSITHELNKVSPTFIGKLGYDSQVSDDLRFRITGSVYTTASSISNTLYNGDRTGSRYYLVMENTKASTSTNAWSGRFDPIFKDEVTSFMINPFIKFKGIEFFGTYEIANGRTVTEVDKRKATQIAADLIYRFPANSNFWVGLRYNTVNAELSLPSENDISSMAIYDVNVNRIAASIGWYPIKNIMAKLEYVNQEYKDFPTSDIRYNGKFNGVMFEAAIGF
jgi:hypothetical protein